LDPSQATTAELKEEQRLLYVAMTQAKGISSFDRLSAFLHSWPERQGRSPSLHIKNALHTRHSAADVRADELADGHSTCQKGCSIRPSREHRCAPSRRVALASVGRRSRRNAQNSGSLKKRGCRSLPSASPAAKTVGMAHPVWQGHAVPMATAHLASSPARSSAKEQRRRN
jgi:hypothetical protein